MLLKAKKDKPKNRAPRNKTIELNSGELALFKKNLLKADSNLGLSRIKNKTIFGDTFKVVDSLPNAFADLIFADPPYNLNKNFKSNQFSKKSDEDYMEWLDSWLGKIKRLLKPNGSIYICGDWRSSSLIYFVGKEYFIPRNRIIWERDKGRGAKSNWKNCSEDIWFFTNSNTYTFNLEQVKIKRKVIAPYVNGDGLPKDWENSKEGKFRLTHPSNLWTNLTVPFWSMSENTIHPTQKPEKLLAKIILASTNENDIVFDPFLGSGTSSVTAKKLNRNYVGIESDEYFSCIAEKRLEMAELDDTIQGYRDNIFWDRNCVG